MSRGTEVPKQEGIGLDNYPTADQRPEAARGSVSREAAHREMDKFRGPDAYATRKLVGRRRNRQTAAGGGGQ